MTGKFASRKFVITLLVLAGIAVLVATNTKMDPDLTLMVRWIVGLYFGGNVGRAAVDQLAAKKETPP